MISVQVRTDFRNLDYIDKNINRLVEDHVVLPACEDIVADIRGSWSGSSPSDPFNPPAVVTGDLDRSIKIKEARDVLGRFASGKDVVSRTIIVESDYGAALEYGDPGKNLLPRPYLQPAIFRAAQKFGDRFKTIFRFR